MELLISTVPGFKEQEDPEFDPSQEVECPECQEMFNSAKALNIHQIIKHNYESELATLTPKGCRM